MILVTLGTHELPFYRLMYEVEACKQTILQDEEIIVQAGHTQFQSNHLNIQPFFTYEEMDALYDQADLIITHAGTGSVITGLKKNKVVIAAPRLKKFGEHNDDHQLQLVDAFEVAGHILTFREHDSLEAIIQQVPSFQAAPFFSGKEKMVGLLDEFINEA